MPFLTVTNTETLAVLRTVKKAHKDKEALKAYLKARFPHYARITDFSGYEDLEANAIHQEFHHKKTGPSIQILIEGL